MANLIENIKTLESFTCYSTYFVNNPEKKIIDEALEFFHERKMKEMQAKLDELPSQEDLLAELLEKLKGKSVHKTLKKVLEGKSDNVFTELKGLFSLGTHIAIECEKDSRFGILLPMVYEKISERLWQSP